MTRGAAPFVARRMRMDPTPPDVPGAGVAVTPLFRLTCASTLVLALLLGQLTEVTGPTLVGKVLISAFLQFGPGVAFCLMVRPAHRHTFALVALVVGPSIVILAAKLAALTGLVSLGSVWLVLAGLTLTVLLLGGLREVPDVVAGLRRSPPGGRRVALGGATRTSAGWRHLSSPLLITLVGLALALGAAATHAGDPRPSGAVVTAGPLWFLGAALVLAGVLVSWYRSSGLAFPVLSLSCVVVASQALMYRQPTAVVAARHIGLVDYILTQGRLDRSSDIYQGWAGLFAAAALNVRAAGVSDVFAYAAWWGVIAAAVMVLAVRCLAGAFVNARRAWLAALLFGLGSSLNTSFFAPQVIGFAMAITILALVTVSPDVTGMPPLRAPIMTATLISVALAMTHQISPYMLTLALVALAVFRIARPWWLFAVPAVPAIVWALVNEHLLNTYVSPSAFGRLFDNLAPPENSIGVFPVPLINRLTFLLPGAALVCIGVAALFVLRRSPSRLTWGLAFAAGSPVVMMAGTSYGQEGVFRVALFALPWLAILACLSPLHARRGPLLSSRLARPVSGIAVTALLVINMVGLTGMDWARVIRRGDVAATQWLEATAPPGSLILSLGTSLTMPSDSSARYAETSWISRASLIQPPEDPYPTTSGAEYDAAADLADLTERLSERPAPRYYAVAADSAGAYDERYGNQRYADHMKLDSEIAASRQWKLVHKAAGVDIYELRGARR